MRVRSIVAVIIIGLLGLVVLLLHKVFYLSEKYEQAQSEIKKLKESRDDEVLMIQISDGDERHSIESKLWNVEDELRRCHARRKTASRRPRRAGL